MRPIVGGRCEALAESAGPWFTIVSASNRHAAAGTSQRSENAVSSAAVEGKSRRLSFGDGRRGRQERNWLSSKFICFSFILFSFQADFQLLQTITVSPGRCVRRYIQQFSNLLEGPAMPDLQHNHFPLFHRKFRQATHGFAFRRRLLRAAFKPA